MPGLFGAAGDLDRAQLLQQEFERRWSRTAVEKRGRFLIGGHAFPPHQAVCTVGADRLLAIDGEWSLYAEVAAGLGAERASALSSIASQTGAVGNLVVADSSSDTLYVSADPTGTFPLYYCEHAGSLLFSSLLKPLARAVAAAPDAVAAVEFLRQAYVVGSKTLYANVSRLLPGQLLSFSGGHVRLVERSTAWSVMSSAGRAELAELAWQRLVQAVGRSLPQEGAVLMMSGGWDSRTILGAAAESGTRLQCYSHGDVESRELHLVEDLCRATGRPVHLEPIGDEVLDVELLSVGFERTENVVFPHWHRAGALLGRMGACCITAGVYGEVLGGHYGPAMLAHSPARQLLSVGSQLLAGRELSGAAFTSEGVRRALQLRDLGNLWYLDSNFRASLSGAVARINADVNTALDRLLARGIQTSEGLVEAFITEHRGAQYINAQVLSLRSHVDIALPFARSELFVFSSGVPLAAKIHNSLSRRMLAVHAPHLLAFPMAATLVPARAPILVQEASRLVRKIVDARSNRGRTGQQLRRGWVNFEFLRNGQALNRVVDALRSDIWDRDALRRSIAHLARDHRMTPHPVYDQFGKILTVDFMLR